MVTIEQFSHCQITIYFSCKRNTFEHSETRVTGYVLCLHYIVNEV